MTRSTDRSVAAFERASRVLVGGVNSPVRAFAAVGGEPLFISRACGSKIYDLDDNEYIDYVSSYGPTILGHAPEAVVEAIGLAARKGTSFGAPTLAEVMLAELVISAIDSIEKVRFTNSGTEAVMTAIRLARGVTGRDKIVKCIGCYHGHSDGLLVQAGSGATTLGVPSSPGVPAGATADTILAPFNSVEAVSQIFSQAGGQIAAVIVEPVAGNMGVVPPADGYLQTLRDICDQAGALLIFDEVMTGFRVAPGGAQQLYNVRPDITTLGKIIGGGMPVGAVGGPAKIMDHLAPLGPVYQAGTLSGNPAAMSAGLASLNEIASDPDFYSLLERKSAELEAGLREAANQAGLGEKVVINRVGSMLCCFFSALPVTDYASATACDTRAFAAYFNGMLNNGVYIPPSQFEAMFVSAAHTSDDIAATQQAATEAFKAAADVM